MHCQLEMTEKQLREQLDAVYASTSWKITSPLRLCVSLMKSGGFRLGSPKKYLVAILYRALSQPQLRLWGQRLFRRFPKLKARVKRVILKFNSKALSDFSPKFPVSKTEQGLSLSSRTILKKLRSAIENKK
jgi:hypothetical protein